MSKRGISALIAVVLILGFTIAVGGVVLTWGGGFIKNLQESTEKSAEKQMTCSSDVRLDIRKVKFLGNKVELLIENVGKKDIEKFHLRIYGSDGVDSIEVNSSLSSFGISNYEVEFDPGKTGFVESVGVFPSIIYGNEIISCSNIKAGEEDFEYSIPTGAVLYIPFDDGSAKDISGNGNDGTIYGADCGVDGKYGLGCKFDGVDDYVDCGNDASLNPNNAISLSAWIYVLGFTDYTYEGIVGKKTTHDSGGCGYEYALTLGWMSKRVKSFVDTIEGHLCQSLQGTTDLEINKWYHVVGIYDSSTGIAKVYLNGEEDAYSSWLGPIDIDPTYPVNIGRIRNYFNGVIDEVMIFNRSLSEGEIKSIYYQR